LIEQVLLDAGIHLQNELISMLLSRYHRFLNNRLILG
jgi:hypothetical protein